MPDELATIDNDKGLAFQPLDLASELERDPRLRSNHTRRGYWRDIQAFQDWRQGRFLSRLLVEEYAAQLLAEGKAPSTVNRALAAVRWYARRIAGRLQETPALTDAERRERAELIAQAERVASVEDVKADRAPDVTGRQVNPGELSALMSACENDTSPAGLRDAALISLAWAAGLRRAEIAGLHLDDYSQAEEGEGADLLIRGKGDKKRTVYVYNGAYYWLVDWLELRGDTAGPVFCEIVKGGRMKPGSQLSGEALRMILDKRIAEAKIKPLTWHDFRRSFAGNLLDAGSDLVTVQKLMGHASPDTTSRYDRRGEEVKRKAVKALNVPYRGRR